MGSEFFDDPGEDALPVTTATLAAMASARSARYFTEDPVDAALIRNIIWAGTRASSPNNAQPWDFIAVTAPDLKHEIATAIQAAYPQRSPAELPADSVERRTATGADHLIAHLAEVPVVIFVCARPYPATKPVPEFMHSAVYAAAQNMLVAARSLGLGAAFTTLHKGAEEPIRHILGIPEGITIAVTMPVGYSARSAGPVNRKPLKEVTHVNQW